MVAETFVKDVTGPGSGCMYDTSEHAFTIGLKSKSGKSMGVGGISYFSPPFLRLSVVCHLRQVSAMFRSEVAGPYAMARRGCKYC